MNTRILFSYMLMLWCFILSACSPSQTALKATALKIVGDASATQIDQVPTLTSTFTPNQSATPTPTNTLEPTATASPTSTASNTSTATLDLTATAQKQQSNQRAIEQKKLDSILPKAILFSSDLPAGFQPKTDLISEIDNYPTGTIGFSYNRKYPSEVIVGYIIPVVDEGKFDKNMLKLADDSVANEMGIAWMGLDNLEEIGQARVGGIWLVHAEPENLYADLVVFRRENVGVLLKIYHNIDRKPSKPVADLARLLDERIMKLLATP